MPTFEEQLAKASSALEENISLPVLGGDLLVFEGQFTLNSGEKECIVSGKVFYSFCEKIELLFEGTTLINDPIAWLGKNAVINAGDKRLGYALVLQIQSNKIKGYITRFENMQSASCKAFRWCYLNAPSIIGDIVKRGRSIDPGRLVFQGGDYQIIYENIAGYREQKRYRKVSHNCKLTRSDGKSIAIEAALDEIRLFSRFVSFFAGCQHAPFFIEGVNGEDVQYQFHTRGLDDSLISVSTWKPFNQDRDLVALWPLFRAKRYLSNDEYDVLNTLVHWYLQANMNKGLLEGAFILAFAGLDLASIEIVGKELSNQEVVADFFKRLNLAMPITAEDLSSMRNQLVHYKKNHRQKYNSLSFDDKVFRLEAVLQILELAILFWLGYKGHYSNRLGSMWEGESVEVIPWIKS